jgi:hypothetical protein
MKSHSLVWCLWQMQSHRLFVSTLSNKEPIMFNVTERKVIPHAELTQMFNAALNMDSNKQAKAYETLAAILKQQAKILKENA